MKFELKNGGLCFFYDCYNPNMIISQIVHLVVLCLYQFDITLIKVVVVNKCNRVGTI